MGLPPLAYQWRLNGSDLAGATDATLLLDPVEASQSGLYSAVVSNAFGVTSSAKALIDVVQVLAWGDDSFGQTNVPAGLSGVVRLAGGAYHSLALKGDGTVVAWGDSAVGAFLIDYGQATVPSDLSNVVAIAAGGYHSLALCEDGTVRAWGAGAISNSISVGGPPVVFPWEGYQYGQSIVPLGLSNVVAIAAGDYHSVALKSDGQPVVWGGQTSSSPVGQTLSTVALVPQAATNLVAIASTDSYIMGLRADGVVVSWGDAAPSFTTTNGVAIAAGVVLKDDGTVISSPAITAGGLSGYSKSRVQCGRAIKIIASRGRMTGPSSSGPWG